MPTLAAHLDELTVESAYLSQWFLSFFAVTCPLPMLFRIYDVLFVEGASETIMRVALALMKRNEQRILALTEFEDVMQLLLGRSLWDPYGRNVKSADDLVNDLVSFTNDVTREKLQGLETSFKEEQENKSNSKVQKSATSFLGRIWGPSNSSTKSVSLSPGLSAPSRPASFLRRTPSKQSMASTLISTDGSETSTGTQSTALTDVSRGSTGDAMSMKLGHESTAMSIRMGHSSKDRDLHYQIEQLLMSVSQLQRQNSELEAALQKQREDRKEDHRLVRTVVDKIRKKQSALATPANREARRRTTITAAMLSPQTSAEPVVTVPLEVEEAAEALDKRFPTHQTHHRASSMFETKEVLRDNLSRAKEQLTSESLRAAALSREVTDAQSDLQMARDALKETRHRLQESYHQNQKLEKTINDLRQSARKGSMPWMPSSDSTPDPLPSLSRSNTADSAISTTGGLRELRLGRSASTKSQKAPPQQQFAKRSSSLATQQVLTTENHVPADNEALLLELVNAKTAEAVAKQELEELKSKFEGMKKAMGVQMPAAGGPTSNPSSTSGGSGGGWGWGGGTPPAKVAATTTAAAAKPAPTTPPATGATPAPAAGGWGWGWKRNPSTNNASLT
jgi:hypothetical protein